MSGTAPARRLSLILAWGLLAARRARRDEGGQAMVESAIIIPLMVFFILGIIQVAMMHHAKIMTDYAAFNAARAGIVWNADPIIMENAAIISLLPTYEGLVDQADIGNPAQMLKRILQRALMYQVNRRISQAIPLLQQGAGNLIDKIPGGKVGDKVQDFLKDGTDKVLSVAENIATTAAQAPITAALGAGDDRLVSVEIINPAGGVLRPAVLGLGLGGAVGLDGLQQMVGGTFGLNEREIDFDNFGKRGATRLTIRIRYLYMMRIPFANWIIHQAWLAGRAGRRLYGAVWNPQQDVPGETGFRNVSPVTDDAAGDDLLRKLAALGRSGVFLVPLESTYSMRMQSNPYKQSLQLR